MRLKQFSTGDTATVKEHVISINFTGPRSVLSTCSANGGYREDLTDVYNYDSSHNKTIHSQMKGRNIEEHMNIVTKELGFAPQSTVGMCTCAQMKNVSIKELCYRNLTVAAIVTGGIDVNGGRVGDKASWHEENENIVSLIEGTINIILIIDGVLSAGILASALMTATEAKVAAIQELLLPSQYSMGIATGSGTDKIIVIANPLAKERLTDAGKHSKLGELIGTTVITAVKEALNKQTNVNPQMQHSVFKRMARFGIRGENIKLVDSVNIKSNLVVYSSLYAHLMDQYLWGLLNKEEVLEAAEHLLKLMESPLKEVKEVFTSRIGEEKIIDLLSFQFEEKIKCMIENNFSN
jgi:adenosylcobinamide hydrolase